jgi:hypothetical protein
MFIVTYELAQQARVLHYNRLESLASNKHSNLLGLLGLFLSYDENEVLWIRSLGTYSQHFILFVTYKQAQ